MPDLSLFSPELAAFLREHPELWASVDFHNSFEPKEGVDYDWLVEHAETQLKQTIETYNKLDDKATSIITHLGSGTGLFALGSVIAVAGGNLHWAVAVSALVPFGIAITSLWYAIIARHTNAFSWFPSADRLVVQAEEKKTSKARLLGYLELCEAVTVYHSNKRAEYVDKALNLFVFAVATLALPLLITTGLKVFTPSATPPPPPPAIEPAK